MSHTHKNTKPTLADVLTRYRDTVVVHHRSGKNVTYALNAMLRDHSWLTDMKVKKISAADVAQWRDQRLLKAQPSTVAREMTWLRHALELARGEWCMFKGDNPATLARKPRQPRARERRLQGREWHRLLSAASELRSDEMKHLMTLAVETGMRRGELVSMRWDDIDFDKRTVVISVNKSDRTRTVPLSPLAVDVLKSVPHVEDGTGSGRVFSMSGNAIRLAWVRLRERVGCPDLRWHDLRHEACSRFVERGLSLVEVQKIMGHADLRMLMRYTHLQVDDIVTKLHHIAAE